MLFLNVILKAVLFRFLKINLCLSGHDAGLDKAMAFVLALSPRWHATATYVTFREEATFSLNKSNASSIASVDTVVASPQRSSMGKVAKKVETPDKSAFAPKEHSTERKV